MLTRFASFVAAPIAAASIAAASIAIVCYGQTPPAPATPPSVARPTAPAPASAGQAQSPAQPVFPAGPIVAQPAKANLGLVKPSELVTKTFKLVNPLDRDVVVVQAATSCQCTGVDIQGKTIPARSAIDMPVSMKMSNAPIRKMASVTMIIDLGDGTKQPLKVEIEAEVAYAIRATPGFIDAQTAEHMKGTFVVAAVDGKPFHVTAVQGAAPVFEGFDPAKDPVAASYTLRYDFTAPNTVVPKYLIVESDRDDCPMLDLRVRHATTKITPPFKVGGFRSSFGRLKPGETGSFDVELEDIGTNRVTSVRSLSPAVQVTMTDQKPDGKNLVLFCSVKPAAETKGLVIVPVEIVLGGLRYEHLLFGAVR